MIVGERRTVRSPVLHTTGGLTPRCSPDYPRAHASRLANTAAPLAISTAAAPTAISPPASSRRGLFHQLPSAVPGPRQRHTAQYAHLFPSSSVRLSGLEPRTDGSFP